MTTVFLVPDEQDRICCNGGGGALGHPKVYYTFRGQDRVTCGYCDRVFTKTPQDGAAVYQPPA